MIVPVGLLGGGFTPLKISGIQCWLRSDLGITLNGSTVSAWASQVAGVTGNATQSASVAQPTYSTSGGLNSQPRLIFDGSNKGMLWALTLEGAKTVLLVLKVTGSATTGYSIYSLKGVTGGANANLSELIVNIAGYATETYRDDMGGAAAGVGYSQTLGTSIGHYLIHTYNGGTNTTPGNYTGNFDGAIQTVASTGAIGRTATDVGAIGGRQAASFLTPMDLYEIAVFNKVVNSTERAQLNAYAKARYGL